MGTLRITSIGVFSKIQPVFLHSLGHLLLFLQGPPCNDMNAGETVVRRQVRLARMRDRIVKLPVQTV